MPTYLPPLNQLLQLGTVHKQPRVNYAKLGFEASHIPALVKMLKDDDLLDSDDPTEAWTVVHVIRVLADLRAEAAVGRLIAFLKEEDDWLHEEAMWALARIGPAALPALRPALFARLNLEEQRWAVAEVLGKMPQYHPEAQADCLQILLAQLQQNNPADITVNGLVVASLININAREALPVIQSAFEKGCVAEEVVGDWEDVQIAFKVLKKRTTPAPHATLAARRNRA